MTTPRLIIISGPPGAGKSRLARPLARKLGFPLFERDAIKERLADALGSDAAADSSKLGFAAFELLFEAARELLASGRDVVIEAFFHKGRAEVSLGPLIALSNPVLVHVTADEPLLVSRFERRARTPDRHWVHNDVTRVGDLRQFLAEGIADPLDLPIPLLVVDTTYGSLDPEEIAFMIREDAIE